MALNKQKTCNKKTIRMSRRKIVAIMATGPSGNGKTTYLQLLKMLLKQPYRPRAVQFADMSDILMKWGMNQNTSLGGELRQKVPQFTSAGILVPDTLTMPNYEAWHGQLLDGPVGDDIEILLLGGAPRTWEQAEKLRKFFSKIMFIHIRATRAQADEAIMYRLMKKQREAAAAQAAGGAAVEVRSDDLGGTKICNQKWAEYETYVEPAANRLGKECIHLDRATPLRKRLKDGLEAMNIKDDNFSARWIGKALRRLRADNHPVHLEIRNVENPEPANVEVHHAHTRPTHSGSIADQPQLQTNGFAALVTRRHAEENPHPSNRVLVSA